MSAGPEQIAEAVRRLNGGGLVAFPTETVYGLGADALSAAAVERVYELKGRPAGNPLIVHVSGPEMARRATGVWPDSAQRLAEAFWPGPLSIVLPKDERLPDRVTGGGSTVAVRCPDHPLTLALIDAFGGPLVGPSANRSGMISPTDATHVRASFSEDEVFVLDGGPCPRGIESTVLRLEGDGYREATVLRPGVVGAEAIASVLDGPVRNADIESDEIHSVAESPGLMGRHYAPRARAVLVDREQLVSAEAGEAIVAIDFDEAPEGVFVVAMPSNASAYAARLYAAVREADEANPSRILIERPPLRGPDASSEAVWRAVHDRLRRATAPA